MISTVSASRVTNRARTSASRDSSVLPGSVDSAASWRRVPRLRVAWVSSPSRTSLSRRSLAAVRAAGSSPDQARSAVAATAPWMPPAAR